MCRWRIDILADILTAPAFEQGELERERQVVLQELGQAQDTPDDIVFDHLQAAVYPDQPMGWPILGTNRRSALHAGRSLDYMGVNYRAGGMTFMASGAVDHAAIVRLVEEQFAGLTREQGLRALPARYVGSDLRSTKTSNRSTSTYAFPGVAEHDPDNYAAQVYATTLGGGMSSRLFQEAREKRGLCYSIYAFAQASRRRHARRLYRHGRGGSGRNLGGRSRAKWPRLPKRRARKKSPAPRRNCEPGC